MSSGRVPEMFPEEAQSIIEDISQHVRQASVSRKLTNTNQKYYINLTTLEKANYCIEMTISGFRVVGRAHDDTSLATIENMNYESIYALLNSISEGYRKSFGGELMSKLMNLAKTTDGA